jgi:hypothetical protein
MITKVTSGDLNDFSNNPIYSQAQGIGRVMTENLGLVPLSPTSGFVSTASGGTGSTNFSNNSTGDTMGSSQTLRLRVTAATTTGNYSYADIWLEGETVGVVVRSDSNPFTLWVGKECFRCNPAEMSTAASMWGGGFPSNTFTFIPRDRWGNPILFSKRMKRVRVSVACDATATQDCNLIAFLVTKEFGRQIALQSNIQANMGLLTASLAAISTSSVKGHNFITYTNIDSGAAYLVTIADSANNTIYEFVLNAQGTAGSSVIVPFGYGAVGGTRGGLQHKCGTTLKVRWATFGVAGGVG